MCMCVSVCISVSVSAGCGWWLGSLLERKALWWTSLDPLGRYRPTSLFSIYGSLWNRALSLTAIALPSPRDLLVHHKDPRPLRRCSLSLTLSLRLSHADTDTHAAATRRCHSEGRCIFFFVLLLVRIIRTMMRRVRRERSRCRYLQNQVVYLRRVTG